MHFDGVSVGLNYEFDAPNATVGDDVVEGLGADDKAATNAVVVRWNANKGGSVA